MLRRQGSRTLDKASVLGLFLSVEHLQELSLERVWVNDSPFLAHLRCKHLSLINLRHCHKLTDASLGLLISLNYASLKHLHLLGCIGMTCGLLSSLGKCEALR